MQTAGTTRTFLSDLLGSTGRFLGLELVVPFLGYALLVGITSALGLPASTAADWLGRLIGFALFLVVLGLIAEYFDMVIGFGIILVVAGVIAGILYVGLKQLLGPLVDQVLALVGTVLELALALVLLLVVLAISLSLVGAAVAPFYFAVLTYLEGYESVSLDYPVAWILPPAAAIVAVLGRSTLTGSMTHNLLVVLFLSVGSLALRTALYVAQTGGASDSLVGRAPTYAFSVPSGVALSAWVLAAVNPSAFDGVESILHSAYGTVAQMTPFAAANTEAVLLTLAPTLAATPVVLGVHLVENPPSVPRSLPSISKGSGSGGTGASKLDWRSDSGSSSSSSTSTSSSTGSATSGTGGSGTNTGATDTSVYEPDDDERTGDTKVYDP